MARRTLLTQSGHRPRPPDMRSIQFQPLPKCSFQPVRCLLQSPEGGGMRRREFLGLLGSAAMWPAVARAQQHQRIRRIGIFMPGTADDPEYQARNAAFLLALGALGWDIGRSMRLEYRWGRGETEN